MSCSSLGCVKAENPVKILSAKPEWHKSQATFIRNLCMEKEKERRVNNISSTDHNYKIRFCFGSDICANGSPDNFVFRQRYLRSYQLTRDDQLKKKTVKEKMKRWFVEKKGKSKLLRSYNSGSCAETCLKFLLCFVAKVDVKEGSSTRSFLSVSSPSTISTG
ncbi:hypothetical protein JCGZ_12284 [Jatropha curcas]|uniref:Uncharacterized protein n=1 Tax=Jatropha curcas TaxID=180498 RepID=A0A067KA22_JATCU|nr:hypothetical protein JCGZ_12284 [Jatropha curcas]